MTRHRLARALGLGLAAAVVLSGLPIAAAQERTWLQIDAVDADGRTWRPTDGEPVIDLLDAPNRDLTLSVRALMNGVASFVFSVDDVPLATVDAGPLVERERTVAVADGQADAEEITVASSSDSTRWPAGFTYHTSSDLELGVDPSHGPQVVYLAFENVQRPEVGRIVRAEVRFTADGDSSGPLDLAIAGVAAVPPEAQVQDDEGTASAALSALERTAATVAWTPESEWIGDEPYATPDLTPVVLEALRANEAAGRSSLALVFDLVAGDGTRRAASFDGRSGAAASLHLWVEEPAPPDPVSIALPDGDVVLTVTAHAQPGGAGAPLATFDVNVTRSAATEPEAAEPPPAPPPTAAPEPAQEAAAAEEAAPEPAAPEEAASEPVAPEEAAPEPAAPETAQETAAPEPAPEAAPDAEPTSAPTRTIRAVDLRSRSEGGSLLTVVLGAPADAEVTPVIRSGTCANPGAVLLALRTVLVGQDGSVTEIDVSATALRLGGFVVVLEGEPDACLPLD